MTVHLPPQLCGRQHFNSGCCRVFFNLLHVCHEKPSRAAHRIISVRSLRAKQCWGAKVQDADLRRWIIFTRFVFYWEQKKTQDVWRPLVLCMISEIRWKHHAVMCSRYIWLQTHTHTHLYTRKYSENKGEDTWDSPVVWVVMCTSASSSCLPHVETLYVPTAALTVCVRLCVCVCVRLCVCATSL